MTQVKYHQDFKEQGVTYRYVNFNISNLDKKNEDASIWIKVSLKLVSTGSIDNRSA